MSLSSSLFTGTSGLKNMGNAMQVVGNNLSNLNTIGFKKGRTTFADTLYESVATQAGSAQMGRGMAVGDVAQNFDQGSFESTGNATDLSIGGDGFFIMRQSNSLNTFYTRAGNFFFNKDGQLVNPEGYIVQGWNLDDETGDDIGSITDLVLQEFTSPPKKSEEINVVTNLDADANSNAVVLSNVWDSDETTYIGPASYEYSTVVKAYDALGSTHDISVFYDKKSGTEWEYIITMNPEEDNRNLVQNTDSKGLLARGTITFSQSSGNVLDFTMSKFTGRLGNFMANGVNTVDDVEYEVTDYDAVALDGYGFSLQFDGSNWNFADVDGDMDVDSDDLPENYTNAVIVYSDDQNIHLTLTPDDSTDVEPDLKIRFDQPAVATDSIGFDINDKNGMHIQGIEGLTYFGDTANDNTLLSIDDPGVMTVDSENLGIVWNPVTETWYWSNPEDANLEGTLLRGVSTDSANVAIDDITIENEADLNMVAAGINLRYDGRANGGTGGWDWNMPLKAEDFTNQVFSFAPLNDPILSIVGSPGSQGAIASLSAGGTLEDIELTWDGAGGWTTTSNNSTLSIDIVTQSNTQVEFYVWEGGVLDTDVATLVRYQFGKPLTSAGGQTISFTIEPTPPEEYPAANLTTSGVPADGIGIDFDGDTVTDLIVNTTAGGMAGPSPGDHFEFSTNPDRPPEEYPDAILRGDHTEAVIDLDGSGNEDDDRDIVFSFTDNLKYGENTHPFNDRSVIAFDIKGSTAWTEISKDSIQREGFFEFTPDFLGGEFGTTETDIKFNIGTRFDGMNFVNDSLSTTQYSKSSSTIFQDADGYAAGDLQGVDVASDGILTGIYSNGQLIPLFRIGLAKFLNNYGLSNEGGNLFAETRESGSAITNKPGENGLGTLAPNSLEMSNVDISEEFVNMITQQRGFQANSKTVTTVDEMMETVISMKR